MGLKVHSVDFGIYSYEDSLRYDFSFIEYVKKQKKLKSYYTFSDLFSFVDKQSVNISNLTEIEYVEIGNISKEGDISPVKLDLLNRDDLLDSYYKKIDKGDIIGVKSGDILLSSIRPYLKKIALIDNESEKYFYTKALIHLRPKIEPIIAYYLLRTAYFESINAVSRIGKGYPTLKTDDLKTLIFDKSMIDSILKDKELINNIYMQIEEINSMKASQESEAEIINEVFAEYFNYDTNLWKTFGKGMTAGTQKSNNKALETFKTNFEEIELSENLRFSCRFHRPITKIISTILQTFPLIQVKNLIISPIHRGKQPKVSDNGTIPAIKTGQLKNSYIDLSESDLVEQSFFNKYPTSQVCYGNILIASTGKVSLGKIDLYNLQEQAVCDGHISIIQVDTNKIIPMYFVYFFRSILGAFQIERDYTGATNQIELYANEIGNFEIINIDIEQQKEIVEKIHSRIKEQQNFTKKINEKRLEIEKIILDSISV